MPLKDGQSNFEITSIWIDPNRRESSAFDIFVEIFKIMQVMK